MPPLDAVRDSLEVTIRKLAAKGAGVKAVDKDGRTVFHLRNAYLIDISLSRAFLAGVYPVGVHLIGVLLKVPIQSRNLHLDRIAPARPHTANRQHTE
jgi:hypothetical protein